MGRELLPKIHWYVLYFCFEHQPVDLFSFPGFEMRHEKVSRNIVCTIAGHVVRSRLTINEAYAVGKTDFSESREGAFCCIGDDCEHGFAAEDASDV